MAIEGVLEYAAARVQARHAALLDDGTWCRIEASRDFGHFLGAVRTTRFADWVATVEVTNDAHAIEQALRSQWRQHVAEIASWHPLEWQPWLRWLVWLPEHSFIARFKRDQVMPAWLANDPVYAPASSGPPWQHSFAVMRSELALFSAAKLGTTPILKAWHAHWQKLLPRIDAQTSQLLGTLIGAFETHYAARSDVAAREIAYAQITTRLTGIFRRAAGTAIATVSHLGLLAIQLERLRGGLVSRSVFGHAEGAH